MRVAAAGGFDETRDYPVAQGQTTPILIPAAAVLVRSNNPCATPSPPSTYRAAKTVSQSAFARLSPALVTPGSRRAPSRRSSSNSAVHFSPFVRVRTVDKTWSRIEKLASMVTTEEESEFHSLLTASGVDPSKVLQSPCLEEGDDEEQQGEVSAVVGTNS